MKPGPQILLVDSNADDARLVREVVESAGLGIHVRTDGASAIEAFHAIQPDLVLIDDHTPEGDGVEVSREIRQTDRGRTTPIVIIGGDPNDSPDLLLRPLEAKALLSTLAHHFPSAFLPSPPSAASATTRALPTEHQGVNPAAQAGASSRGLPQVDSFEDEDLGQLLDIVFPAGDSGDLAGSIAGAHSASAAPKPGPLSPSPPPDAELFEDNLLEPPAPERRPAQGDIVSNLAEEVERLSGPDVLARADAVIPVAGELHPAPSPIVQRYPEAEVYVRPPRHRQSRGRPAWVLPVAASVILAAGAGLYFMIAWRAESDLRPVVRRRVQSERPAPAPQPPAAENPLALPQTAATATLEVTPVVTPREDFKAPTTKRAASPRTKSDASARLPSLVKVRPSASGGQTAAGRAPLKAEENTQVTSPTPEGAPPEPETLAPAAAGAGLAPSPPSQAEPAKEPPAPGAAPSEAPTPGSSPDGGSPAPGPSEAAGQGEQAAHSENNPRPEPPAVSPLGSLSGDLLFLSPVPLHHPRPKFPSSGGALNLSGTVRLLVKVAEDGTVAAVRVIGSVAPAVDQAAVSAARGWKYRPAKFGDRPVAAWVEESVEFKPE